MIIGALTFGLPGAVVGASVGALGVTLEVLARRSRSAPANVGAACSQQVACCATRG